MRRLSLVLGLWACTADPRQGELDVGGVPGTLHDLACQPMDAPSGEVCWSCSANGHVVTHGCAVSWSAAAPAFCLADLSSGSQLCVLCCDATGTVLAEACEPLDGSFELSCEEY